MRLRSPREIWTETMVGKTRTVTSSTVWYISGEIGDVDRWAERALRSSDDDDEDDEEFDQNDDDRDVVTGSSERRNRDSGDSSDVRHQDDDDNREVTVGDDSGELRLQRDRDLSCWWDKVLRVCAKKPNLRIVPAAAGQEHQVEIHQLPRVLNIVPVKIGGNELHDGQYILEELDSDDTLGASVDLEEALGANSHLNYARSRRSSSLDSDDEDHLDTSMGDLESPGTSSSSDGSEHAGENNQSEINGNAGPSKFHKRAPPKPKRKNVRGANQRILRELLKERKGARSLRSVSSAVLESIPEEDPEPDCVWGWIYVEKIPLVPIDLKDSNVEAFYQQLEVTMQVTVRDLRVRYGFHGLCLQLNGVKIRKLRDDERPLELQCKHLAMLGHSSPLRIIWEGLREGTASVIAFSPDCSSFVPSQSSQNGVIGVLKGLVFPKWRPRFCSCASVRTSNLLLVYPDCTPTGEPEKWPVDVVEELDEPLKGCPFSLKVVARSQPPTKLFLGFYSKEDRKQWFDDLTKGLQRSPSKVDLSSQGLDSLPEGLFQVPHLTSLDLSGNHFQESFSDAASMQYPSVSSTGPGSLDNLNKLEALQQLNLSSNRLQKLPHAITTLKSLGMIDLSFNDLSDLQPDLSNLNKLETLVLEGNRLKQLPSAVGDLHELRELNVSWNSLQELPGTFGRLSQLTTLELMGNRLTSLPHSENFASVRHLNISNNSFSGGLGLQSFTGLEVLDVSSNSITRLDLQLSTSLKTLKCQRNKLNVLVIGSDIVETVDASYNCLEVVTMNGSCLRLKEANLKKNNLTACPPWLLRALKLEVLNLAYNRITTLTCPLDSGVHNSVLDLPNLREFDVHHNIVKEFPQDGRRAQFSRLEKLAVHSNRITMLPGYLFKCPSLKVLNASSNMIDHLDVPPVSRSVIEKLYLTDNRLNEEKVNPLGSLLHIKILHISFNDLQFLPDSLMTGFLKLEELSVCGNKLKFLPPSLTTLPVLRRVYAHSNHISSLPQILGAPVLEVLDVSCNRLQNVPLPLLICPSLRTLDLSFNTQVGVDAKALQKCCRGRSVRLVATTADPSAQEDAHDSPWSIGFAERSSQQDARSVVQVRVGSFRSPHISGFFDRPPSHEALIGLVDGRGNSSLAQKIGLLMPSYIRKEQRTESDSVQQEYLKHAFLSVNRDVKSGHAGAITTMCHMSASVLEQKPNGSKKYLGEVRLANVGNCIAYLFRGGQAQRLTKDFTLASNLFELERLFRMQGIVGLKARPNIAELEFSRMIGGGRLHPGIVPDPYLNHVYVKESDSWLILGNPAFWDKLTPEEAFQLIRDCTCATKAAKKLADFACSYGVEEDVSVLAVKFCLEQEAHTTIIRVQHPPTTNGHNRNRNEERETSTNGSSKNSKHNKTGKSKQKDYGERLPELRRSMLPSKARQREISRSIDSLIHQAGLRPKSRLEAYHEPGTISSSQSWLQSFNTRRTNKNLKASSSLSDLHAESIYSDSSCTSCNAETCSTCSCSSSCSECSLTGNEDRVLGTDVASLSPHDSAVECDCSYSSSSVCREEQLRSLEQVLSKNTRILFSREIEYARKSLRHPAETNGTGKLASRWSKFRQSLPNFGRSSVTSNGTRSSVKSTSTAGFESWRTVNNNAAHQRHYEIPSVSSSSGASTPGMFPIEAIVSPVPKSLESRYGMQTASSWESDYLTSLLAKRRPSALGPVTEL